MVRDELLPFARPDIDEAEHLQVQEVLRSGWLTTGAKAHRFESEFAAIVGARHGVAVNSCTAAMHLALEAIGVERGDEVITTPYTFAATAEVVRYFDATPVLVDIRPSDLNIDPTLIEQAITQRTRAILPVHIGGLPAELDAIYAIANRYGLAVVEDAAHAFPARYKDCPIGSLNPASPRPGAHAVCFSFYATKPISTGEGGMITTDDDDLAERCRIMTLHGIRGDAWKRYASGGSWYYEIVAPGFKYNMTDLAAALGLAQLTKAEQMWQRRMEIAQRYHQAFKLVPALQIPYDRADCQHAWHLYMLRLHLERLRIDRAQFIQELKNRNIDTSVHFIPLHLHPYYQKTYGYGAGDFPVAYREYLREISLPIYSKMSDDDVRDVIETVTDIAGQYRC
ncbi:MAG: DegT/DnrJ/EryC1/StrS family aminotransferase [Anaerolineae bacterium]